jgi:hypothetical protein
MYTWSTYMSSMCIHGDLKDFPYLFVSAYILFLTYYLFFRLVSVLRAGDPPTWNIETKKQQQRKTLFA